MAKTVTQMDDDGRIVTHKQTRSRSKSEAQLIGWTRGPQTRAQKLARALWG
jgi:hypothetical protein